MALWLSVTRTNINPAVGPNSKYIYIYIIYIYILIKKYTIWTIWAYLIQNHARNTPTGCPNNSPTRQFIPGKYVFLCFYVKSFKKPKLSTYLVLVIYRPLNLWERHQQMRLDESTCLLSVSRLVLAYESSYGLGFLKNMPIYKFWGADKKHMIL